MAAAERPAAKRRPVYLDLPRIRLPMPGFVSFLHRFSGAMMFAFGIPLLLVCVGAALASPDAYAGLKSAFSHPLAKLVLMGFVWAYLHHLFAGIRHLLLDLHVGVDLLPARRSSAAAGLLAIALTLIVGVRLW